MTTTTTRAHGLLTDVCHEQESESTISDDIEMRIVEGESSSENYEDEGFNDLSEFRQTLEIIHPGKKIQYSLYTPFLTTRL